MRALSTPTLLKRLPPGVWLVVIWCASTTYALAEPPRWDVDAFSLLTGPHGMVRVDLLVSLVLVVLAVRPGRRPLQAFALVLGSSLLVTMAIPSAANDFPQFLPAAVALCYLAATQPRRTARRALVMAMTLLAGYWAVRRLMHFKVDTSAQLIVIMTTAIIWLVGASIRQNRDQAETVRAQAATAERLRIARDLHDMVAHSIGIIAIQAGMGSRVMDTQPQETRNALDAIEATSRETLAGLRRMMGALRQSGAVTGAAEPAPLAPAPGLSDLDRLVAAGRNAGLRVDLRRMGTQRGLPVDIELSAYRIVQESLTNVVRHAGTDRCRVTVDYRDEQLAVEIADDGRGDCAASNGSGYGITGMRERVGLLHGEFAAGPRPGGGFRVAAVLPLPGTAPGPVPAAVTVTAGAR